MELSTLRAYMNGELDESAVLAESYLGRLDEIHTGAFQSIQHAINSNTKDIKQLMNGAKTDIRNDKKADAKKKIDKALSMLRENRKEAEKIDDDGILESILISSLMSMIPGVGSLAYSIGFYVEWYTLRKQADKGDTYSKTLPGMKKNLILEFFFGKLIPSGYSRSAVLAGYDKLIDECEAIKRQIK